MRTAWWRLATGIGVTGRVAFLFRAAAVAAGAETLVALVLAFALDFLAFGGGGGAAGLIAAMSCDGVRSE